MCHFQRYLLITVPHQLFDGNTLQHNATHCSTLPHTATYCNTLQHTAAHCSTLQHTATHRSALQHRYLFVAMPHQLLDRDSIVTATKYNKLQRTASRCNALQHAAAPCNSLQHAAAQVPFCRHAASTLGSRQSRQTHAPTHHLSLAKILKSQLATQFPV